MKIKGLARIIGLSIVPTMIMIAGPGCKEAPSSSTPSQEQLPESDGQSPAQVPTTGKLADREGPPSVPPVILGGMRYVAIHDGRSRGLDQDGGYVAAMEPGSGQVLWTAKIYSTVIDPTRETDVQDVFIAGIRPGPDDNTLIIENEDGQVFLFDVSTRKVTGDT